LELTNKNYAVPEHREPKKGNMYRTHHNPADGNSTMNHLCKASTARSRLKVFFQVSGAIALLAGATSASAMSITPLGQGVLGTGETMFTVQLTLDPGEVFPWHYHRAAAWLRRKVRLCWRPVAGGKRSGDEGQFFGWHHWSLALIWSLTRIGTEIQMTQSKKVYLCPIMFVDREVEHPVDTLKCPSATEDLVHPRVSGIGFGEFASV
jgi:hypothetical protein